METRKRRQEKTAGKKSEKKAPGREQPRMSISSWLKGMDEGRKKVLKRIAGLLLAAFAIFTFLAVFSYLFTWKADQSLLTDPQMMDRSKIT